MIQLYKIKGELIMNNENINGIITCLSATKKPIVKAFGMMGEVGYEGMNEVLCASVRSGNMVVANAAYKSILLARLHNVKSYISSYYGGRCEEYLSDLSIEQRELLLEDFISMLELGECSITDMECLKSLEDSIRARRTDSVLELKSFSQN